MLSDLAPAKINLTLHVLGRRADGFHDLESLVVFADLSDRLRLEPDAPLSVATDGDFAAAAGPQDDNLVVRAARALSSRVAGLRMGRFSLTKVVPVAAGLGGGSSDAAAALRLLARLNGLKPDDERIAEAAAETGSDVPVCLDPCASMMLGRGERVVRGVRLPPLHAVLVNPRRPVPTAGVFRALGLQPGEIRCPASGQPEGEGREALFAELAIGRNDMEDAAIALEPQVGTVLDALRALPAVRLARMSGSGATVFALVDDAGAADSVAARLQASNAGWWVAATVLR